MENLPERILLTVLVVFAWWQYSVVNKQLRAEIKDLRERADMGVRIDTKTTDVISVMAKNIKELREFTVAFVTTKDKGMM